MISLPHFDPTMTTELARHDDAPLARKQAMERIAAEYARNEEYELHWLRLAENTRTSHAGDMRTFVQFLVASSHLSRTTNIEAHADAMMNGPEEWQGIGYGMMAAYRRWLLDSGYSHGTISHKLSTVRVYAKLAILAVGDDDAFAQVLAGVKLVSGHTGRLAENLDAKREEEGTPTRKSTKRRSDEMVALTRDQVRAIKAQCDAGTPQGRRDAVLICLAFDHGMRIGEICGAVISGMVRIGETVHDVGLDLAGGTLRFYREKTRIVQRHKLSPDSLVALRRYADAGDMPAMGPILRSSRKGGRLDAAGMTTTAASARIGELAARAGIFATRDGQQVRISAHDARHTWATLAHQYAPNNPEAIREAGGWKDQAMQRRYIEPSEIANQDICMSW